MQQFMQILKMKRKWPNKLNESLEMRICEQISSEKGNGVSKNFHGIKQHTRHFMSMKEFIKMNEKSRDERRTVTCNKSYAYITHNSLFLHMEGYASCNSSFLDFNFFTAI